MSSEEGGIIVARQGRDYTPFSELLDLACETVGGSVLFANDDFFAAGENLVKLATPVFIPSKYTEQGKWMDGWESRRKRVPGHDWAIIKLGVPGVIHGVNVDTAFFTGNYPEYASLDAAVIKGQEPKAAAWDGAAVKWTTIVPKTKLRGDTCNLLPVGHREAWTHLRLNIFPDGGVARLRVHGEAQPDWDTLKKKGEAIDLAAVVNGGSVLTCNDNFYGPKDNLILPGRAPNMGGGWETRRRRGPGNDWLIVKLARAGRLSKLEIDTNHFKGNFPDTCSVEGLAHPARDLLPCDVRDRQDLRWQEILPRTKLKASERHYFDKELRPEALKHAFDYVRINVFPDGGISRFRVYGEPG